MPMFRVTATFICMEGGSEDEIKTRIRTNLGRVYKPIESVSLQLIEMEKRKIYFSVEVEHPTNTEDNEVIDELTKNTELSWLTFERLEHVPNNTSPK
jgi:hypothetical protein